MLPERPTILFAHAAYRLGDEFARRGTGLAFAEVRNGPALAAQVPQADVLVVSGLWSDALLDAAPRLAFVQSISAGVNQYGRDRFAAAGVRLASAQGANERAVAEHALALMLALTRRLGEARDNQASRRWRSMIGDPAARERELAGRTLAIVGLGRIGSRLARLAKALDMRVIATKRDPRAGAEAADRVVAESELAAILPEADVVALTCPLTPQTENLIDRRALARMKPDALLVNVARGRVVDEAALIAALEEGRLGGAALDCTVEEPLPAASPLWGMANVLVTPHTAGETERYETNVIDLLIENLARSRRGVPLVNQIV
jgi:phosphoglycerate dehydrogenase-like enzyme